LPAIRFRPHELKLVVVLLTSIPSSLPRGETIERLVRLQSAQARADILHKNLRMVWPAHDLLASEELRSGMRRMQAVRRPDCPPKHTQFIRAASRMIGSLTPSPAIGYVALFDIHY